MNYYRLNFILFLSMVFFGSCSTAKNTQAVTAETNLPDMQVERPGKPLAPIFSAYSPKGNWMVTIEFEKELSFEHTTKAIKFSVPAPQAVAVQPNGLSYSVNFDNGDQFTLIIYESVCGKTEWGREAKIEGIQNGVKAEAQACGTYTEKRKEKKMALFFVEEVNGKPAGDFFGSEEIPRVEFTIEGGMVNGIFGCRRFMGSFDDINSLLTFSFLQAPNMNCHEGPKTTDFLVSLENKGLVVEEKDNRLFMSAGNVQFVLHKMD
jgi:heat shock protein HslJ